MTFDELFQKYDALIHRLEVERFKVDPNEKKLNRRTRLGHTRWMLHVMRKGGKWLPETYSRWLGFVQGVLWCEGLRTLKELAEDVKECESNSAAT